MTGVITVLNSVKKCLYSNKGFFCEIQCIINRNSSYSPDFIEAICHRNQLDELKQSEKAKDLKHVPIKAARSEQTCSVYYDATVEKFINYVMKSGKKDLARLQVNKTLETIKRIQIERYHKEVDPEVKANIEINALNIFHKAIENCKPVLGLTPIKRGGSTYQVPVPITNQRATFLSMNWLIEQGKAEPRTTRFYTKLAHEMISASKHEGRVIKKKQELHRQCEANRAYAHYRWS